MGIGGTAMGSVAILLKQEGHKITGSDQNLYPPMSARLLDAGIKAYSGYDASRLEKLAPDLVVVGNVIGRGNPEAEWLLEHRYLTFLSLPQLIGKLLIGTRDTLVVTGTHGKTTTTALITHILKQEGANPGYLIAGVPQSKEPSSALGGKLAPFVIEGDEYDSAFFDKRSKFIHYYPRVLIINNLEFDHGDIFRDLEDIQRSFSHVVRLVPKSGHILINGDDPKLTQWVTDEAHSKVWRVGTGAQNDLQIVYFKESATGSSFSLLLNGQAWIDIHWELPALYNARNAAMASLACALQQNPDNPYQYQSDAANQFRGVKRRQELRYESPDLYVFEDFGHHPTAVRQTLESMKSRFPKYQIWACFEPRSNTSRSPAFQDLWPEAFKSADQVFIGGIHRPHLLQPNQRLNTQKLASSLNEAGVDTIAFSTNEELCTALQPEVQKRKQKTVIIFFTNGSFDGIIEKTIESI